jgi:hypothetical protein
VEKLELDRNSRKDTCPNASPASSTIARTRACAIGRNVSSIHQKRASS